MRSIVRPILLMGLLLLAAPVRAAEAPVLVILPFEVAGAQGLEYLRETLLYLLAGRMAEGGEATVVAPRKILEAHKSHAGRPLTDQDARDLGRSLGADYVFSGQFTTVGEGFRVEGRLLNVGT